MKVEFADCRHVLVPAQDKLPQLTLPFARERGLFRWRATNAAVDNQIVTSETGRAFRASGAHQAKTSSHVSAVPSNHAAAILHHRLHLPEEKIRELCNLTNDAPPNLAKGHLHACPHCLEANARRLPHSGSAYKASRPGRLTHGDIVGPFRRSINGHFRYMLVLTDDHTRYKSVYFLCRKSEALRSVRQHVARMSKYLRPRGCGLLCEPVAPL